MVVPIGSPDRMKSGWLHWNKSGRNTTHGDMVLSRGFKEFVALLNENDVLYLVVGGYAVASHGHPRYTKNLDMWIEAAHENAGKILVSPEPFRLSACR